MSEPSNLVHLAPNTTTEDFNQQVASAPGLVVVDFFATWCPPCKALGAQIPTLAKENPNIRFIKVDVEENNALASQYKVSSIPHVAFVKHQDGAVKLLDTVVGMNMPKIKGNLTKYA